jgi:hypothetical protein
MYDQSSRFSMDDLIPMLVDDGIALTLAPWLKFNPTEAWLTEAIQMTHSVILLTGQMRQLIADLAAHGSIEGVDVAGLPSAIERAAAPTGIGCAGGNVWVTPPGDAYTLRFYVNGEHKITLPDYYITSLESIGAVTGDVVQVCQVVDGVPGWWARIVAQ